MVPIPGIVILTTGEDLALRHFTYLYVTKFVDLRKPWGSSSNLLFLKRKGGRDDPGETDTQPTRR
jgi:hypothetical protein